MSMFHRQPANTTAAVAAARVRAGVQGFTLIELMVTLAVMGILLSLALPDMANFLQRTRMDRFGSELRATVNYAKLQALRSGQRTVVCRRVPGQNVCSTNNAEQWQAGWLVFHDVAPNFAAPPATDANNQFDVASGETLLKVSDGDDSGSFWAPGGGPNPAAVLPYIAFTGQGVPAVASNFCIRMCADQSCSSNTNNRYLIVNAAGHARLETQTTIGQAGNTGICS